MPSSWKSFVISIATRWSADCVSVRKIGSGAAFVSTQPGATEGWRLSANGRRESANGQPEDCVRRSNCPTQAKRRLEWATRHPSAPAKITSRPSIMGFRVPLHNPLDARISHWGRPFPTFVAGTTHLKLQESNAVGLRQDPSQNPRWLKIGNAHPWRKTAKDGPRTARRRER